MPRRCLFVIHYPVFGGPPQPGLEVDAGAPLARLGDDRPDPDEPGNAAERLRAAGIQPVEAPLGRMRATADPRRHLRFFGGFPARWG